MRRARLRFGVVLLTVIGVLAGGLSGGAVTLAPADGWGGTGAPPARTLVASPPVPAPPPERTGLIAASATIARRLGPRAQRLRRATRDLDAVARALTADRGALPRSLHELAPTLRSTRRALRRIDAALPGIDRLADDLRPTVARASSTLARGRAWTAAARRLIADDVLGRWTAETSATVPEVRRLAAAGRRVAGPLDDLAGCVTRVLVPALGVRVEDGRFTTGKPLYQSIGTALSALRGAMPRGTDTGLAVQSGLGPHLLDFGPLGGQGTLLATTTHTPIGVRPARPSARPPFRTSAPCAKQPVPDPNAAPAVRGDAAARLSPRRSVLAREGAPATGGTDEPGLGAGLATALARSLDPLRGSGSGSGSGIASGSSGKGKRR